jgi:pimeloyl-ACP methyl ester carboxylesterase
MPTFEHEDVLFHYEVAGEGPVVALCHGLCGELSHVRDVVGPLPGHRTVLWDARGHGRTPPGAPDTYTFDVFARDLAALLDHLGVTEAVIGGISMGAAVSTRFAIKYPERTRGLVLIRPAWLTSPLPDGLRLFPVVADYLGRFSAEEGCRLLERSAEYQALEDTFPDTAATLRAQFFENDAVARRGRLHGIPNDTPIRSWDEITVLEMPTLVFGNTPDVVHPLSFAMEWAQRLPRGEFVQTPSRTLEFDQHAEVVRIHLKSFLAAL